MAVLIYDIHAYNGDCNLQVLAAFAGEEPEWLEVMPKDIGEDAYVWDSVFYIGEAEFSLFDAMRI